MLYGSCTLGIYSDDIVIAYLCKILALGGEAGSRNSVQFIGSIELCVSALVIHNNTQRRLSLEQKTSPTRRKLRKGLHIRRPYIIVVRGVWAF